MQIQLKQAEIIEALKQYVSKQGIALLNKEVTIDFTAGRKNTGISADISIEDTSFPLPAEEVKPVLTVVKSDTGATIVSTAQAETPAPVVAEPAEAPAKSLFS